MPGAATRQQELTTQLKDQREKDKLADVEEDLRTAVEEANTIPLRNKTQFMFYPEIRTLTLLKAIAKLEETSVQDLIRTQMDTYLDRRLKQKPKRKRVTKKGA